MCTTALITVACQCSVGRYVSLLTSIKSLAVFIKQFNYDCNIFLLIISKTNANNINCKEYQLPKHQAHKLRWKCAKILLFIFLFCASIARRMAAHMLKISNVVQEQEKKAQKKEHTRTHFDYGHHRLYSAVQKWNARNRRAKRKTITNCMRQALSLQNKS